MKELRVTTRDQLLEVTRTLAVRSDWHEPDEQGVTAVVHGTELDNAGFWGFEFAIHAQDEPRYAPSQELWIELRHDSKPVAEVNLADLLAWATAGDHGLA